MALGYSGYGRVFGACDDKAAYVVEEDETYIQVKCTKFLLRLSYQGDLLLRSLRPEAAIRITTDLLNPLAPL